VTLWKFVVCQLRASLGRAVVLGVGLLVAAVGFSLLSSESTSSAIAVRGTLNRNFRPAYDILVRPSGTRSETELTDGLVNDGFLSDLYGGISIRQWHTILGLPGVSVAAPVENVGYVLTGVSVELDLRGVVGPAAQQLYRVAPSFVVHDGLASYPVVNRYFYYSTDKWVEKSGDAAPSLVVPGRSKPVPACLVYLQGNSPDMTGPFDNTALEGMVCAGPQQDVHGVRAVVDPPGDYQVGLYFEFPVLVAAIDPVQEAKLVDLPKAVVSGSYLQEGEGLSAPVLSSTPSPPGVPPFELRNLPMLASSSALVDENLQVKVEQLSSGPATSALPDKLASPSAGGYLDALAGRVVMTKSFSTASLYKAVLAGFTKGQVGELGNYWTTGGVRYRTVGKLQLTPLRTSNSGAVWEPIGSAEDQSGLGPPGGDAAQYRRLTAYDQTGAVSTAPNGDDVAGAPEAVVQGTFDAAKLPGFAPLSKVPLATFYPPTVTGATSTSRAALGDRPLGPTTNIGGYLGQPPLFLTTLKAATALLDPSAYTGNQPRGAPIAAIQVRVSGLSGANTASIDRARQVATEIYRATHLQVDITAGSSPTPVRIDLPADRFGQPALQVQQGWVKKGVATVVLGATKAKDIVLFVLVLVIAGLFVANASFASVRQRRAEIATLATLGWARRQIFAAVLAEVAVIGLAAGIAGSAIAALIVAGFALHFEVVHVVIVIPASVVVAVAAGAFPAWQASRLSPLEALARPVRATLARRVRSVTHLGTVNLVRLPGRTALGAFGLVVGVGALTLLLGIQSAFAGDVAGDVLGNAVDVQVRTADYVAVILVLLLAAGSVADVLVMNLRERSGELAALRACGWDDASLRRLVITEGVAIGVIGSLLGVGAGLGAVSLLGAPLHAVAVGAAATFAAGILLCATAVLPALSILTRQDPARALASD
jgi:putative ABC transport system permease protein